MVRCSLNVHSALHVVFNILYKNSLSYIHSRSYLVCPKSLLHRLINYLFYLFSNMHSVKLFELLWANVWVHNYISIINRSLHKIHIVFLLKNKSDVLSVSSLFIKFFKRLFNTKLIILQTDVK